MAKKAPPTKTRAEAPPVTAPEVALPFNPTMGTGDMIQMDMPPRVGQMLMPSNPASDIGEANARAMIVASMETVRGAMMMAREFPRDEKQAYQSIMGACMVPSFAEKGLYSWDQGKGKTAQKIEGPTVYMMKEISRRWGHIHSGAHLVADSPEQRTLRCFARDLQTGTFFEFDVTFAKVIFRKFGDNREGGEWRNADERELLQLTNAQGSRGIRNAIRSVVPDFIVSEAIGQVKATMNAAVKKDPKGFLKALLVRFETLGIEANEIEDFVGFDLEKLNADQLRYLANVAGAVEDGVPWTDYLAKKATKEKVAGTTPPKSAKELKERIAQKAAGTLKPDADPTPPEPETKDKKEPDKKETKPATRKEEPKKDAPPPKNNQGEAPPKSDADES